jgi:hypothetical protein
MTGQDDRSGADAEVTTVTLTKDVYRFDAENLRNGLRDIADRFGARCVVVSETKKRLSVTITFAVTGTTEQLANFAAAVKPGKGTTASGDPFWEMLLGG